MDFDSVTRRFESYHPSIKINLFFLKRNIYKRVWNFLNFLQLMTKKNSSKKIFLFSAILSLTKNLTKRGIGTATFLFYFKSHLQSPFCELSEQRLPDFFFENKNCFKKVTLNVENKQISTDDMEFIFKNGKPYLLKCVFYFQNRVESFQFYNFLWLSKKQFSFKVYENKSIDYNSVKT